MKYLIPFLCLFSLSAWSQEQAVTENGAGAEQPVTTCSSAKYRQFDFWIGDWNVSENDQPAGTNSIHPIIGGCALQENWQGSGTGGLSGTSFNIYDQANDQWHQTWVDSSGTLLQLDGGLIDGKMVLSGQRPKRDGSGMTLHRITWTPNEEGTVRQYWEASTDDGATWTVLFDGLYVSQGQTP
jgi:hypothetical protein